VAKTNIDLEFELLSGFNQKQQHDSSYKAKFFSALTELGPVSDSPGRERNLNKLFEVLDMIKSLKTAEQKTLKSYLQKIVRELETPSQRLFLHHLSPKIGKFGLSELSTVGIDPDQLLSSTIHNEITKKNIELKPTRIVAFNKIDASNREVLTSLRLAYAKHQEERVLITCSAKDLQTFGRECETLVLIGHGTFYREGESMDGKTVTKEDVEKARKGNTLGLGPYHGKIDFLVSHLSDDLKLMPKINHCRILMCRAGAADVSISSAKLKTFEKKHRDDPKSASIMQQWDPTQPTEIPYDKNSLASAFWHKLFVGPEKWMTKDHDFALTVSSSVIKPEVTRGNYAEGFFKAHEPESLKHHNPLVSSRYITLATSASSKFEDRITKPKRYSPK
jgi:hypothetical protein